MQEPKPAAQHDWLRRMVGTWTSSMDCSSGPDMPTQTITGRETVRALGDLWVIADGAMTMPGGGDHRSSMSLGFDPAKNAVVGTFVSSMMAMLWLYEGQLDAAKNVLTLSASGPSMMPGADPTKHVSYRDVIELINDDERVMTSATAGPGGEWVTFMTIRYRRTKS